MPLTLDDIPLLAPMAMSPEAMMNVKTWVERNITPKTVRPWLTRAWPGFGLAGVTWPTGYTPNDPIRVNHLIWPIGASRWAFGHFLVDSNALNLIRNAAYGTDGSEFNEITLKMSIPGLVLPDGSSSPSPQFEPLETSVYLLSYTPLGRMTPIPGGGGTATPAPTSLYPSPPTGSPGSTSTDQYVNGLYLITIVDERYYWWNYSIPIIFNNIGDTTTWQSLFTSIETTINVTINLDTINPAYLQPSRGLALTGEVIPPVLDAMVANIGQRLVRKYDGNVYAQNFDTANAAYEADFSTNPDRQLRAGGERFHQVL
jgi:hypothetical protein